MFGDGADGTNGGLLWVDEGIHEELLDAMNSGKLEEKVQLEHPEITAIRYIPPGTELPTSTDPDGIDEGFIGARSSALSWLLIGLGFFVLLSVFVYLFISRRRGLQEEEERNTSAQVGAFPIVVSPQNVARAQGSHHESSGKATNTYSEISRHYSTSADLLISNNQSDSDDSDHDIEGTRLHVFHDDDNSPRQLPQGISTGWRDQILRNSNNRAPESPFGSLDPNQPFVRPILHDEQDGHGMTTPSRELQSPAEFSHYHSAHSGRGDHGFSSSREYYSSAEFSGYHSVNSREYGTNSEGGSSLSSSPRHLSPSRQDSPSKLTVAFDRGEML